MSSRSPKPQKSEQVTQQLLEYIKGNKLQPGDHLPTEEEMARLFNVSRISLRAATDGLKFFGILSSSRRWGTVIAKFDFVNLFKHPGLNFAFHSVPMRQLQQLRDVLECGLLEEIANRMTHEQYLDLCKKAETCQALHRKGSGLDELLTADYVFHSTLLSISGNQIMVAMMQLLSTLFDKSGHNAVPQWIDRGDEEDEHRQIIDALHLHKVELARSLMRLHLARWDTIYQKPEPMAQDA